MTVTINGDTKTYTNAKGFDCEVHTFSQFVTVYETGTDRPVATLVRRRYNGTGPAWTIFTTDGKNAGRGSSIVMGCLADLRRELDLRAEVAAAGTVEKLQDLTAFERGYVEAAFFTEEGEDGIGEANRDELTNEALQNIRRDCVRFQSKAKMFLALAYSIGYLEEQAGRDFWLTRNGHGTGFWARDLLTKRTATDGSMRIGEYLTAHAKRAGSAELYMTAEGVFHE